MQQQENDQYAQDENYHKKTTNTAKFITKAPIGFTDLVIYGYGTKTLD